jgi:amidase
MAGHEIDDPLSFDTPGLSFTEAVGRQPHLQRVAFSPDLGGITPVDSEVASICRDAALRFAGAGVPMDETSPDLSSAEAVFTILRAARFAAARGPLLAQHRSALKPEVVWNIETGLALTAERIGWAERERAALFHRMSSFMQQHDLLLCPAAIVPPFTVDQRYVAELNGHRFPSYIDWVSITYAITLTGCPVLSLPCGFTKAGLPVGLQLVGKPRGEAQLLAAAAHLEQILGIADRVPFDPVVRH